VNARQTNEHLGGGVVHANAAENGGSVVGDLDRAGLAERLEDLVL
jgi:hypothetical protein